MQNLLAIYRNYLHRQKIDCLLIERLIQSVIISFNKIGLDLKALDLSNFEDVKFISNFYSPQSQLFLSLTSTSTSLSLIALYKLGECLVSESFLSENPAEKLLEINVSSSKFNNSQLRELIYSPLSASINKSIDISNNFGFFQRPAEFNFSKIFDQLIFRPRFVFPSLALALFVLLSSLNLPQKIAGYISIFYKSNFYAQKLTFKSLSLAKPVYALDNNDAFNLNDNLFDRQPIVSASANRVTAEANLKLNK